MKNPPDIDLITANPGDRFAFRDGTTVRFRDRIPGSSPDGRSYRFFTEGVSPPFEVMRTRYGKFSETPTDTPEGRDIIRALPPLEIDLSQHIGGQRYRFRDGTFGRLEFILPADSGERRRFRVSGRMYPADGKLSSRGRDVPYDIVEVLSPGVTEPEGAEEKVAPTIALDLSKLELGQLLKRRDGKLVRLSERGLAGQYPFKVSVAGTETDTYTAFGGYMATGKNDKDLVAVVSCDKKTPLTVAQALGALARLTAALSRSNALKAKILLDFVRRNTEQ